MNKLREQLSKKETVYGTVVCLTDPCVCEMMGAAGYDCVWVDMEHTYTSPKEVLCHLNGARAAGISSIVRVPQNDLTYTKKVLEMGPEGIIFPMVRSAAEAKALIDMTLYPPLGNRGFGPIRAIRYGADDAKNYAEKDSLDMLRFIQIEHIDCVEELEEIAKIPYLDGCIFGPCDLSFSVGHPLDVMCQANMDAIEKSVKILREHGKLVGLSGSMSPEAVEVWSKLDLDLFFSGGDWCFLFDAAKKTMDCMKKYACK